jgi:hypothetical protein
MRRLSLRWCFLGLAVFLVATLSQGTPTTYAAAGSIVPNPAAAYAVVGAAAWHNSNATLTAAADPSAVNIQISDQSYLREGWVVKVDSEQMLIGQLVEGGYGNPDTMVVTRAQGGTSAAAHASGTVIQAKSITVDIWAQNVSDPDGYGFGAFEVDLTFPSNVEMIKMTYDYQWLYSTGRFPDCYPATEKWPGSGTWQVSCFSENNPGPGQPSWYPLGPSGSGRIARVTVLPPPSEGLATVSLAGSFLNNTRGTDLSATLTDLKIKTIACPDATLDGRINTSDLLDVAYNLLDKGVDSGATMTTNVTASQPQIDISDQSKLSVNDTIGIDGEQMKVLTLVDGWPDTMTVTRAIKSGGGVSTKAATHQAGAHIFRATTDGNGDGYRGYTRARDVTHDGTINTSDLLQVAYVLGTTCPSP